MKKILLFINILILLAVSVPATAKNDYQMLPKDFTAHLMKTPHGKIEYYRFGHGTPLALITGYFANVTAWNMSLLTALAANHDVIIFNNRNISGSINSSKSYTTADLANDTHDLLKGLHLTHANILGISMGGMIAQQFAISYPEKVDHLILINTFLPGLEPIYPNKQVQNNLTNMPHNKIKQYILALKTLFPPEDRFHMFFVFLHDRFNPASKETPITPAVIKQQQKLVLGWINNKAALEKIKQLEIPTLILSGGSDYIIPPANADILHKSIPHSNLIRWKNGGHAMTFQYPDSLTDHIDQWLRNH